MKTVHYLSDFLEFSDVEQWLRSFGIERNNLSQCWEAMQNGGKDQEGKSLDYCLRIRVRKKHYKLGVERVRK